MNHDNICTTIKELLEKVEAIESEMQKNRGGRHYRGLDRNEPGSDSRAMEAMAQNRKLKPKLIEALNALACAYQQKGDEHRARDYFDQAKRYCDEVNHE